MAFSDPFILVLRRHQPNLDLGSREVTGIDRAALSTDLEAALRRNSHRYYTVLSIIVLLFIALLTLTFLRPNIFNPKWLLSGTGVFAGGFGAVLTSVVRSWWRTDTLLTVCKYADEKSLGLIIAEVLKAEAGRGAAKRR